MRISHAITWARRVMKERGIDTASDATCRRYILSLKNSDYPAWVFYREGEQALENKCGYTLERDYDKLAVGDQLTADGHVLNFTVLNPWTGKPCRPTLILWYDTRSNMPLGWELMPTENTQAIHVALRRAIIALGKVPKVAYLDNGRAFRSEHFTSSEDFDNGAIAGLYARLGIVTSFATPYHGQSKTVERFFGSLLEMESILPTYVGTSNQNKPARMHRGESLHRKLWEKYGMARVAVTMEQAHHIIAAWFDEYAHRPQRGHLNGKSPMEIFQPGRGPGVDRALLTELMMSVKITKTQKTGIKMFGQTYYHPALYGRRDPVVVRHDMMDRECLYIYATSGEFVCCAEPKSKTHPCARILGDDADKEMLQQELATKNRIKTMTVGPARELLQTEILPEFSRLTAAIGVESQALPKAEKCKSGKVISLAGARKPIAIPASFDYQQALEEAAENAALQAEIEARDFDANLEQLSEADRYEELIKLTCQGKQLAPKWTGFMSLYEQSADYARFREYWESCWTNCRLLYGPMEREAGQAQA
jgi:putative transposase